MNLVKNIRDSHGVNHRSFKSEFCYIHTPNDYLVDSLPYLNSAALLKLYSEYVANVVADQCVILRCLRIHISNQDQQFVTTCCTTTTSLQSCSHSLSGLPDNIKTVTDRPVSLCCKPQSLLRVFKDTRLSLRERGRCLNLIFFATPEPTLKLH